jgi:hypothetical protein
MYLRETGLGDVDWTLLTQNSDRRWDVVNMATEPSGSIKYGYILTNRQRGEDVQGSIG